MTGRPRRTGSRNYPRTARINEVMREVLADELERIDDDRLGLLTITGVTVDGDLRYATVWLSALMAEGGVDAMLEAVHEHRKELQATVARQLRMKRTPLLKFAADPAITTGQRIEEVIRTMPRPTEAMLAADAVAEAELAAELAAEVEAEAALAADAERAAAPAAPEAAGLGSG